MQKVPTLQVGSQNESFQIVPSTQAVEKPWALPGLPQTPLSPDSYTSNLCPPCSMAAPVARAASAREVTGSPCLGPSHSSTSPLTAKDVVPICPAPSQVSAFDPISLCMNPLSQQGGGQDHRGNCQPHVGQQQGQNAPRHVWVLSPRIHHQPTVPTSTVAGGW